MLETTVPQVSEPDVRTRLDYLVAAFTTQVGRDLEHWPAETLAEYTAAALELSVRHANRSAFYAERLGDRTVPTSIAEFQRLPFTYPAEIKGRLRDLLACSWDELAQVNLSSGTTAGPTTYVGYTAADLRGDGARYAPAGLFAFDPSDLVAVALPYDMATVGLSIHRDVQRQGAVVLPAGKGGSYGPPERLVQAIAELGVTTLFSTPSFAWYLAELFEQVFPGAGKPIAHLRLGGEGAAPTMLTRLGLRWGATVRQWYGSTEIGVIAYSCEQGTYHVAAANCFLEIVDADGGPVPDGTIGAVVTTTLGRGGTPLIRYHSGDRAVLLAEPCGCGRTLPALRMFGRATDQLPGRDGGVSPYVVEETLLRAVADAEPWYHVELTDTGTTLVAEWPAAAPATEQAAATSAIVQQVAVAGLDLDGVRWAEPGTLDRPRTKMRRVRDERTGPR
ncbi:phenylacetate--CoA ligase family protein [Cryptosporangium aurantiacum]|uniref:Phenylacetate-CoA ligase n=1 Tax=Cryptosporangium aurantiacum TaxID=134849 RepID=A0A1M7RMH8_9ACTN|nr:AMP-binding protein [Cryptosporangium aurantiacum]SHN47302.1 phenylacetate-CoA ligase [Cryptosporangium aurantiacum]